MYHILDIYLTHSYRQSYQIRIDKIIARDNSEIFFDAYLS